MQIQDKIVTTLPIFKLNDDIDKAIHFFEETTFSHIAVIEKNKFVGLLVEMDLGCFESGKKVKDYEFNFERFSVEKDISWFDILEEFARNESNLLPILNEKSNLLGYYDLNDVVSKLIQTPFFTEPGGVLVISKGLKDYSFSEIGQIVESNNSRLLGALITDSMNDVLEITLKVGSNNLNEISQTFRRYGYTILYGNKDDAFLEDLKKRSDYLDKYLNI